MNRNYNSIDIMKFVMSIFVIVIHCYIIDDIKETTNVYVGNGVMTLLMQSVPFFFATSAYLLFTKLRFIHDSEKFSKKTYFSTIVRYLKHIFRMYVIWFVIFTISQFYKENTGEVLTLLSKRGYAFFFWGGAHLWFLWAMLLVMPLLAILVIIGRGLTKPRQAYMLIVLGAVGMCFFRFYSHYGSVIEPVWWQVPLVWGWQGHVFNVFGVCDAFMYLSVGVFFALTDVWRRWNKLLLVGVVALGFIFSHFDNGAASLVTIPMNISIMSLVLRCDIGGNVCVYRYIRSVSTFIYLVHPICIDWAHKLSASPFVMTSYSIIVCVICSTIFVALSNRIQFLKIFV